MPGHAIDYSKSSLSVCKGPSPCSGSPIAVGSLRYGELVPGEFGEIVIWRHWGCVTPDILRVLATVGLNTVTGFNTLRPEDQGKVSRAIALGRVDPADIPPSARVITAPTSQLVKPLQPPLATNSRQQKRKWPSENSGPSVSRFSGIGSYTDNEDEEVLLIEPEPIDELCYIFKTRVVGVQHYKGLVGAGEQVTLQRDPRNPYDKNAIKVVNIGGMQVGHIPRDVAAQAAPLLDKGLVSVEGVMLTGNLLISELRIYGASDKRAILEPLLAWATPHQHGGSRLTGQVPGALSSPSYTGTVSSAAQTYHSPSVSNRRRGTNIAQSQVQDEVTKKQQEALHKAKELAQILGTLEKVDDDSRRTSLLDTLCAADDILNLPAHPNPPGVASGDLVVDLLKHQSQALQWCIEHEYPTLPTAESDRPVQFWQYRKAGNKGFYTLFLLVATKTPQEVTTPPILGRGALVADSMGLGKTLTMLSLILATKKDVPSNYSQATLIVVPLSVISNWEQQIEEHCTRGALTTYVYYGASRNIAADELAKHEVVITTYQTVVGEVDPNILTDGHPGGRTKKKRKVETGLFDVKWKRIILDEGHSIRNAKTKTAKAVCKLTAQRRWVLSGTPIDLGSILTFLQICRPLDNEDFFKRLLLRPLKEGDPVGAELLRALMTQVCIRRTKEVKYLSCVSICSEDLCYVDERFPGAPPSSLASGDEVDVTLIPVSLHEGARALYDAVEAISHQRVETLINQSGGMNTVVTSNVLSMLTRLRQIALHPGLIPVNYLEQLQVNEELSTQAPVAHIAPERLQDQLSKLIEDSEECPICFGILTDPRITPCAHAFCFACISEVLARDPKCPMDRRRISARELVEPPPLIELTQLPAKLNNQGHDELRTGSSAKIDQLLHLLKLLPSDEKSLVFSQFTSFLDKASVFCDGKRAGCKFREQIGQTLSEHGIPYVRFDGQLSARKRQEILERFSIPLETESCIHSSAESTTRVSSCDLLTDDGTMEGPDFHQGHSSLAEKSKKKASESMTSNANPKSVFDCSAFQGTNPRVMLISLKAGALGLNLTVANNVFLWWQEGIESQAIDRCNRIGQRRPVHVYQLIAENTVESKVMEIQERKKKLIQHVGVICIIPSIPLTARDVITELTLCFHIEQAFAGARQAETQRERREARLQGLCSDVVAILDILIQVYLGSDLIQLLGIQQHGHEAVV
ncbi:SNF2 family N-terminal domain-containing protein [Pisolithus microcarpus]|nr:SNF2 family N-terminal domain-containing protein [Pisolithus microcarpus]